MPLVTSMLPTVRTNAVLSLTRLAGNSELSAKDILCSTYQLSQLCRQIDKENKYYKKNCMSLIKNISKYSSTFSEIIIKDCGGLDAILVCMNDFDVFVREVALQAISSITRHNADLSLYIVNSGMLPPIVMCLKEQQHNLKLFALFALDEIAKHNQDLAQTIVNASAVPYVINFLACNSVDIKVQRYALTLIKNIVKHSLFLAECVIESNLFPEILMLMAHSDETIRDNAAKVIREIVKHSVQIAQMVTNNGGIDSLLNVISCSKELLPTPAVLALGYIAAMSPLLASAINQSKALIYLTVILKNDANKYVQAGTIWTLGMIGQHSAEHSRAVSDCGALAAMMDIYTDKHLEQDIRYKCRVSLQLIIHGCDDFNILENLLMPSIPIDIMTYILNQISKILSNNSRARRSFITNGHLKMIQSLTPEIDSDLFKAIKSVNCCFPEDIIKMVAGDFPETVMKTVDKYVPQSHCIFYNNQNSESKEQLNNTFVVKKSSSVEESTII